MYTVIDDEYIILGSLYLKKNIFDENNYQNLLILKSLSLNNSYGNNFDMMFEKYSTDLKNKI